MKTKAPRSTEPGAKKAPVNRATTYIAKNPCEVGIRGTTIARMYIRHDGTPELRILQGMPRDEVVQKLLLDCPEFCESNGITERTYPLLF